MSSRSKGVTKTLLRSVTASCVSSSPRCSWSLMRATRSSASAGNVSKSSTSSRAISTAFAEARPKRSKNSRRSGTRRRRTPDSYQAWLTNGEGKAARDREPALRRARRLDRPAGGHDDVLDDREPEPGAARGARVVGPVEALEQPRQLLVRHACAVVGADEQQVVAPTPRAQGERRSLAGVPDRVLG